MPAPLIILHPSYNSDYINRTKQNYLDTLTSDELKRHYEHNLLMYKQKDYVSDRLLKQKNYFIEVANKYFPYAIIFILLTILFQLYLWIWHDKLANWLENRKKQKTL